MLAKLKAYFNSLVGESDRGIALGLAASFEEELGAILRAHMLDDRATTGLLAGPLGSFAARISACHALGLITTAEQKALTVIRDIRNYFAHNWDAAGFDDPFVETRCRRLMLSRAITSLRTKDRFLEVCSELLFLMIERGQEVPRTRPGWWISASASTDDRQ